MLHHTIREEGKQWHEQIPILLCAYREFHSFTTRVASCQLLYGRAPEVSLSVFKSSWSGENKEIQLDTMPIYEYLLKLKEHFERATNVATLSFEVKQGRMAYHYNLRSKKETF